MNIYFYCQHVLGIGHFFRSLEICKALGDHDLTLITGGIRPDILLPENVTEINLPGLMMDPDFSGLISTVENKPVEEIKNARIKLLTSLFENELPEIFLIELYPFGRKAFRFELDPLLKKVAKEHKQKCRIICSLRDILVEKKEPEKYEKRVIETLNRWFDALLVHSDPAYLKLDETFDRIDDVQIPLIYTGFVAPMPGQGAREKLRRQLGLKDDEFLITASAGGGKVGMPLLNAAIDAVKEVRKRLSITLLVFSGPFMDDVNYKRLRAKRSARILVKRFAPDFLDILAASDLSVSMAGYNTCMNILAAETKGLVWPFSQNREQRFRVQKLSKTGRLILLNEKDLEPERLAVRIYETLLHYKPSTVKIDLQGSKKTARILEKASET